MMKYETNIWNNAFVVNINHIFPLEYLLVYVIDTFFYTDFFSTYTYNNGKTDILTEV